MKFLLSYLSLYLLLLMSGKKTENEVLIINPRKQANTILLKLDKVLNDSTIQLSWTKYPGEDFKSYKVYRSCEVLNNGVFSFAGKEVKVLTSPDSLTFTESAMPFARNIDYMVLLYTDKPAGGSNQLTYVRPATYNQCSFNEAIANVDKDYVYLYNRQSGEISLFNYSTNTEVVKTSLKTSIGYCTLGNFDGGVKNEMYVPTGDGWLYILDAESLGTKDKIYIGGEAVTSALAINEKLFVSSSDRSYGGFYNNSLKVYDRRTKKVISRAGKNNNTRLVYLEASNIEMIDVTTNLSPIDLAYYNFNTSGDLQSQKSDPYHGDYPLDVGLVKSFPDGSRIITATSGTVYSKNLIFEKSLAPRFGSTFSDFEFNSTGSIIYSAYKSQKKIEAIGYPSSAVLTTYGTKFNPFRIFRDGDQLISISAGQAPRNYFLIEKINL